jgi:hypothetical protein
VDTVGRALVAAFWELVVQDPTLLHVDQDWGGDDASSFGGSHSFAGLSKAGRARVLTAMSLRNMTLEELVVAVDDLELPATGISPNLFGGRGRHVSLCMRVCCLNEPLAALQSSLNKIASTTFLTRCP